MARPHVLWFDESYDEERFFLDTARLAEIVRERSGVAPLCIASQAEIFQSHQRMSAQKSAHRATLRARLAS